MKKFGMLGIIGGAAILTAVPLSLQWSQKNVALSLDSAQAREGRPLTATSIAGVNRRVHRRAHRRAAYASAVAGVGAYGYGSYSRSLADCAYYLPYGTSYAAPCGIYSSSYAVASERLRAATATPYGYSYDAPYSYYGPLPAAFREPPSRLASTDPYIALIYVGLGDRDRAMSWLNKAYEAHFNPSILMRPAFDPIRSDVRSRISSVGSGCLDELRDRRWRAEKL
jgi:hypothetical protein